MIYESKNITFHVKHVKVSNKSRPMNVAIASAHFGCERNSCKDWAWKNMCGKHGSNMIKVRGTESKYDTRLSDLFREKCA